MSVGGQLASARESLGLSVEDVSERTRVRAQLLRSIEADDFGPCGGDVYARGHLRAFAAVVGIDAGPLLAEYDREHAVADEDLLPSGGAVQGGGDLAPSAVREPRRLSWTGAGVLGAGVVAVVAVVAYVGGGSGPATPARGSAAGPVVAPSSGSPSPTPSVPAASPPTSGVDVVVRAVNGPSWVGLLPGYKVQVTLQKGQTKEFRDARRVDLRIGNPAAVELVVNGQLVGINGSSTPVDRTFQAATVGSSDVASLAPTQN